MPTLEKAGHQTDRDAIVDLQEIVNVGPSIAECFLSIGIKKPQSLVGKDPWVLYQKVCRQNREIYDPCVLDVFMATIDYMNGQPPQKWWKYTQTRKEHYASKLERFSL